MADTTLPAAVDARPLLARLWSRLRTLLRRPRPAWAAETADRRLARWETWPAWGLLGAAGLNTVVWYVGQHMPEAVGAVLPWFRLGAGVAAVVAIDGSLLATVMGMRDGRRSVWSGANIAIAATFTGLASLAAQGVLTADAAHWLHGLFAFMFVAYLLHLAQPRADEVAYLRRLRAEIAAAAQEVDTRRAAVDADAQANAARAQELTERAAKVDADAQALRDRAQSADSRAEDLRHRAQTLDARDAAQAERAQVQADRAQGLKLLELDLGRQSDALLRRNVELDDRARELDSREAEPMVKVATIELSWSKFAQVVGTAIDRDLRSVDGLRALVTRAGKEG